ncbi:1-acyl-sn-glycerol-3-phosphate acyltransferase [Chloroflexota bacterium]
MTNNKSLETTLKQTITDEAFRAMGFSYDSVIRKVFGPLMSPAASRFARLVANVDQDLEQYGIAETSRRYLPDYVDEVTVCGAENIPKNGPLIIASNHPGTLDAPVIFSALARDDVKLIISGVPLVHSLSGASQYLIYTPYDDHQRISVVRSAIRHLKDDGLLMIFPTGKLDPDPEFLPGADQALELWSDSLEIFLRRVPGTIVIPTIVSGVFAPSTLRNPLTKLRKEFWQQQRIAEYIQVFQMMFLAKKFNLNPKVTFGEPLTTGDLLAAGNHESIMSAIIDQARQVLAIHTASARCLADEN